jgi:hypothetical protein
MKFRTELPVPKFPFQISYDDHILLLGSRFLILLEFFCQKTKEKLIEIEKENKFINHRKLK